MSFAASRIRPDQDDDNAQFEAIIRRLERAGVEVDLFAAIDRIAERIRALGYPAPMSIADLMPHSAIAEAHGSNFSAEQMMSALISDNETVSRRRRDVVEVAEDLRDAATADMLTERLQVHQEAIWMLRAIVAS